MKGKELFIFRKAVKLHLSWCKITSIIFENEHRFKIYVGTD